MEDATTLYFKRAVQMLVSEEEFKGIKDQLSLIPIIQRKAFWNLILAGFSAIKALDNCKRLYLLKEENNLEYEDLLKMILFVDVKYNTTIYSKRIRMFELN